MDTTPSTVTWVGQEQGISLSPVNKSTTSGTMKTCFECQYAVVEDMDFEHVLTCRLYNTYVLNSSPICSNFIKESWVK